MHPGVYLSVWVYICVFFFYLTDRLELAYLPLLVCAIYVIYARC